MPRKKVDKDLEKPTHTAVDKLLSATNGTDSHLIMSLPLDSAIIDGIIKSDSYVVEDTIPIAYRNADTMFELSEYKLLNDTNKKHCVCFWCTYNIPDVSYSMPCNYDNNTKIFGTFGTFCSLECVSAFNFSINSGSDKVWYINSLIHKLAISYGITDRRIRPAPSKYVLEKFGGTLSVEEYRKVHQSDDKTYVVNIPPMMSINSSIEGLNSSYIKKK